jgi:hypothetical protein
MAMKWVRLSLVIGAVVALIVLGLLAYFMPFEYVPVPSAEEAARS